MVWWAVACQNPHYTLHITHRVSRTPVTKLHTQHNRLPSVKPSSHVRRHAESGEVCVVLARRARIRQVRSGGRCAGCSRGIAGFGGHGGACAVCLLLRTTTHPPPIIIIVSGKASHMKPTTHAVGQGQGSSLQAVLSLAADVQDLPRHQSAGVAALRLR